MTNAGYVFSNASPDTVYSYRVKTANEGGEGDWSTGAFCTADPFLRVATPNGGEAWRRGLPYNDGFVDLYLATGWVEKNAKDTLWRNQGDGTFVQCKTMPFETSTNPAQWTKIAVRTNLTGTVDYTDNAAANDSQRYCRGVAP